MTTEATTDSAYCAAILPKVSRTFALGIRLLPSPLRDAVQTSYLLCRIADTIEDSPRLPGATKRHLLHHFRASLDTETGSFAPVRDAFANPASDEERLVYAGERVLREFRRLSDAQQAAILPWVQEMASGMADFAGREDARELRALRDLDELDHYCYIVAGTVGHLLTALFRHHEPGITDAVHARLGRLAASFGLGLQLTNIIKDVADDRRRGWCFVPAALCETAGLAPDELQHPERAAEARKVMRTLIDKARGHLDDALTYCLALPARAYRIRVFCLTSLYFAVRTLHRAERDPRLLDPTHKVKISRGDVYRTLATTHVVAPFDRLVRRYYHRLAVAG